MSTTDRFRSELIEHSGELARRSARTWIEAETCPENIQLWEQLLRDVHSLKGCSELLGSRAVALHVHSIEDALAAIRESGNIDRSGDALLSALDLVPRVLGASETSRARYLAQLSEQCAILLRAAGLSPDALIEADTTAALDLKPASEKSVRVARGVFDALLNQLTETVSFLEQVDGGAQSLEPAVDRLRHASALIESASEREIDELFRASIVATQSVARRQNKKVVFDVRGRGESISDSLFATLVDPIFHLLRNAISHGIEPTEERRRLGKPDLGSIVLNATGTEDGSLELSVQDDGRGFPQQGVDTDYSRLFASGVSTSPEITVSSGRGVGLDAVRRAAEELNATITVASQVGEGAKVSLSIPRRQSLAVLASFRCGPVWYGVAPPRIDRIEKLNDGRVSIFLAEPLKGWLIKADECRAPSPALIRRDPVSGWGCAGLVGTTVLSDGGIAFVLESNRLVQLPSASRTLESSTSSRRGRIVYAEDDDTLRQGIAERLESRGYDVRTAENGQRALDLVLETEPEALLTDIDMPELDGINLILKTRARFPKLPVIALTSRSRADELHRMALAGATVCLNKSSSATETVELMLAAFGV